MDLAEKRRLSRTANFKYLQPGDKIKGPRGDDLYVEPSVLVEGNSAIGYFLGEIPVGVLIFRRGQPTKLRYYDHEGRAQDEEIESGSPASQMRMGEARMSALTNKFLGERHPLARLARVQ